MGGGFSESVSVTVTGANGDAETLVPIGFRQGILMQVTVELTSGDATDTGINIFEKLNGTAYYDETASNSFEILKVATGARTLYNSRDYFLKFTAREDNRPSQSGRKKNVAVLLDFSGGSAIAQTYKITLAGIGVS